MPSVPGTPKRQTNLCPCGSGRVSRWQYDARNIPLCRTCTACHEVKMMGYRREVLTDPNYEATEPIEED